ncbi:Pentapeptide repeats containing protein [Halomicronema hongdechloris C2206]|uniref:Pentapeptide repeats containing protein n=1 Tax=Halomicronema hongdechloris C2206 TaxID=1641165 RepID=A0A1Z3HHS2_9CYAN|nr:pentapeptide repeat-containing protein [Halomicronema hongdechloris]ASC69820.1 Pentapeptide repeats containing protein [Halomicronema hongdechloris C2206]
MAHPSPHHPPRLLALRPASAQKVGLHPLLWRRLLAWGIEVALLVGSIGVPVQLGLWANNTEAQKVALAPPLRWTQTAIARTLALPKRHLYSEVSPLTNGLWSMAVGLPLVFIGSQLYSSAQTGRPLTKRWVGLQVMVLTGNRPGSWRILLRSAGRWVGPLGLAYGGWYAIGAFPQLGILGGLTLLALTGQGLTVVMGKGRGWHDRLAGTVVTGSEAAQFPDQLPMASSPGEDSPEVTAISGGKVSQPDSVATASGLTYRVLGPQASGLTMGRHWRLGIGACLLLATIALGGLWLRTREQARQTDYVFLSLVDTLSQPGTPPAEQQAAVLALANSGDPRAVALLVDWLAQADTPADWQILHQALVSIGVEALPPLHRLNQTLGAEIGASSSPPDATERGRQQVVKQTLAELLALADGVAGVDLSQAYLGQVSQGADTFSLVLEQQNLAGLHWRGTVLTGARLSQSRFSGPGPDGHLDTYDDWVADLRGADLTEADLSRADLAQVPLSGASLLRANLNGVQATYADFSGANLGGAELVAAQLEQAILLGARMTGADLTNANLAGAELERARLNQVAASGVNLSRVNATRAEMQEADLTGADLTRAVLIAADLTRAQLRGADLRNADLRQANLRGADLRQVLLPGAKLAGVDMAGARFGDETRRTDPESFIAKDTQVAKTDRFQGIDFSQVRNLDAQQLRFICAQGGQHPACSRDPS